MDDTSLQFVVDDIDDVCSCDSIYHSIIDTQGGAQSPVPAPPANLAPIESAFSTIELDSTVLKDDRSDQRARQRLEKPRDISKAKRCVRCRYCRPWKLAGNKGRPKVWDRVLRASFAEADGESTLEKSVELAEDDHHIAVAPVTRNVSLADLVKAPRKGSDKRFEMVGRPRQVLVLDEFGETDSTNHDLGEWEHIEVEVKSRKAVAPSYARVVANRV